MCLHATRREEAHVAKASYATGVQAHVACAVRMVRAARSVVCGAIDFRPQRPKMGPLAVSGEVRLRALGGERALRRRRVAATGVPNARHAIAAVGVKLERARVNGPQRTHTLVQSHNARSQNGFRVQEGLRKIPASSRTTTTLNSATQG